MQNGLSKGLVQVYTGPGKGKTTAALGLAFRAAGHGLKVCVVQFMKGGTYYGELLAAQRLRPEMDFYQFGRGCPYSAMLLSGVQKCRGCGECFYRQGRDNGEYAEHVAMACRFSGEILKEGRHDLVILDEIGNAVGLGLIGTDAVLKLIKQKPGHVELVLTGRDMPEEILQAADLVSEIRAVRHPFDSGVSGRRGIEY